MIGRSIILATILSLLSHFILTGSSYAFIDISRFSVQKHLTTDDPRSGTGCSTPVAKTSFSPSDSEVFYWVEFKDALSSDVAVWKWFRPDNSLYVSLQPFSLGISGAGCMWSAMYIEGHEPADNHGTWRAELYINDARVSSDTFTIESEAVACTYTFSEWGECRPDGTQERSIISSDPVGCVEGVFPVLTQSCTYVPPQTAPTTWPPSSID